MDAVKKRFLSIMLTLCMAMVFMPQMAFAADTATNIPYLDASGAQQTCKSATVVTSGDNAWENDENNENNGWYVVSSDVSLYRRVTVIGDVHLILMDGCTLTANGGIRVQDNDNNISNFS